MPDQMSSGSGLDSPMVSEVAKLAQILEQADTRQSFRSDMDGALTAAGIRRDRLPSQALTALRAMTDEELRFLAEATKKLADAGLSLDVPVGDRRIGVFFF